ncbi:MAG: STAS domain-containing protein [Treponema sp.]|nr:STAS domain-containing protein [Treponema sp.]
MKIEDSIIMNDETPDGVLFTIKGRIDSVYALPIQEKLEEAIKNGVTKIILNMSQVEFLSSAGIRVILKTHRDLKKAGGTFGIEKPSSNVKNVLGMAALNELLI